MKSDDLSPQIGETAKQPFGFHQGTIITWSPDTGTNSVEVAGSLLTDLPILNTAEAIALKPGHIVVILKYLSQYFILGRVTKPNDAGFASASVAFDGDWISTNGFEVRNDTLLYIGNNLQVPVWADEALVFVTANMSVVNDSGGSDYAQLEAVIDGGPGRPAYPQIEPGKLGTMAVSAQRVIPVTGGSLIGFGCWWKSINNMWPANPSNIASADAFAVFRSLT